MPRKYNIKWRDADRKLLKNTVSNYNRKISRLLKKEPSLADFLPAKVSFAKIRNSITTRSEFNKIVNSLKRFLVKGAEKTIVTREGIKTTKYQKRELEIKIREINRMRKKRRAMLENSQYRGTYDIPSNETLTPKMFEIEKIKAAGWLKFIESVEKQSKESYWSEKDSLFKSNYIKAVDKVMGLYAGPLKKVINSIPNELFVRMYNYDDILSIDFLYGVEEEAIKYEAIIDTIKEYLIVKDKYISRDFNTEEINKIWDTINQVDDMFAKGFV